MRLGFWNLNRWELPAWLWNFSLPCLYITLAILSFLWLMRSVFKHSGSLSPTKPYPPSLAIAESSQIYLIKMKIFSWMQSKLNAKQGSKKPNSSTSTNNHVLKEPRREEFSDWPHGLLAIGTFGNDSLKEDPDTCNFQGSQSSSKDHLQDVTPEEFGELQKELTLFLHKQVSAEELETPNLQLEEYDRSNRDTACDNSAEKSGGLHHISSAVLNRGKDIQAKHTKNVIGKKSLSFLLKQMFLCRGGFGPSPSLRDPILDNSRMEKILRVILHKKIYSHNSSPKATVKKYLETSGVHNKKSEDVMSDMLNDGSKWVKTDSEFIVLEI